MSRIVGEPAVPSQKELLLLCAKAHIDTDSAVRIRSLAEREPDWSSLLAAAAEHAVAPLVWQRLYLYAGDVLPPLWRNNFREEFARNARKNLFLSAELLRLLAAFEASGVQATCYKGPILAAQGYGDIALRQFNDLDIIVPQKEMLEAHRALASQDFDAEISGFGAADVSRRIPGQYAYRHKRSRTLVELHTEGTLRYMPGRLDLKSLLAHREMISLAGRSVPAFCAEDTLVLLAVHGSKHFWDRLGWIADIAALDRASRGLDWERSFSLARTLHATRMVLLAASLAQDLLDLSLPKQVKTRLQQDSTARTMSDEIRRRFFDGSNFDLGVFRRFIFRVRMRGATVPGLFYAFRLAVTPTETDRREHPMANHFEPAHAIFRPLRLARLYGWRTRASNTPVLSLETRASRELASKLLALAEVSADDVVLDMLTGNGQLAILAARDHGASGIGIVADDGAVCEAEAAARSYGALARVRFVPQAPRNAEDRLYEAVDEELGISHQLRATILFVDSATLGDDGFRRCADAAFARGVRVAAIGKANLELPPAQEMLIGGPKEHSKGATAFRLWYPLTAKHT